MRYGNSTRTQLIYLPFLLAACSGAQGADGAGGSDTSSTGGSSTAGASDTGGSHAGGSGDTSSGGTNSGGTNSGGTSSGGTNSGGTNSGGTNSGGTPGCTSVGAWPANAPVLKPGIWQDITPAEIVPLEGSNQNFMSINIAFDPCHPSILYWGYAAFDSTKGALYKSTDAGTSWTAYGHFQSTSSIEVEPGNPDHVYVGDGVRGTDEGFWVSTNGGLSWTKPQGFKDVGTQNAIFVDDVYHVDVSPSDFDHILVTSHSAWAWGSAKYGNDAGILESTDGGTTWRVHAPVAGWGAGNNAWFLDNASTWLVGSQSNGYWRTTDAGQTWNQVSTINMTHGGAHLYRTAQGVWFTSSSDHILKSTDGGASWKQAGGPQVTTGLHGDGKLLYTHADNGSYGPWVVSPESDGTTWTPYNGGAQSFKDGPFEMRFDRAHRILYSASWTDGLFALKVLD